MIKITQKSFNMEFNSTFPQASFCVLQRMWKFIAYPQLHSQGCQPPQDWPPMVAKLQLFKPETARQKKTEQGKLSGYLSFFFFFFRRSNLECWENFGAQMLWMFVRIHWSPKCVCITFSACSWANSSLIWVSSSFLFFARDLFFATKSWNRKQRV